MSTTVIGHVGKGRLVALSVALLWSAAMPVAALCVPFYESTAVSSSGAVTNGSATLVAENGLAALLITSVPLAITLVVGGCLWRRGARPGAGPAAWTVTGLLAGFNLLAIMSVGIFVVPVTAALVCACAIGRTPAFTSK